MKHPYADLSPSHFWNKAITGVGYEDIDFIPHPKFTLHGSTKIATAGSCFAQNIARFLKKTGGAYFDAEPAHSYIAEEYSTRNGYGVFSARFGNIYTVRQLRELIEQAFGIIPVIYDFFGDNGLIYDLLRPSVQQDGFTSLEEAIADRNYHLTRVKKLFLECDVFVFTLGLTESWINGAKGKGYVYPSCPGTARGVYNPEVHLFKNFTYQECSADLDKILTFLAEVNAHCKVILTVSPVALAATYEDNNVLISTSYSKATLRALCGDTEKRYTNVLYFPSYEIISSTCSLGAYLSDDLREANAQGVGRVMECFSRALYPKGTEKKSQILTRHVENKSTELSKALLQAECDEMYNDPDAKNL